MSRADVPGGGQVLQSLPRYFPPLLYETNLHTLFPSAALNRKWFGFSLSYTPGGLSGNGTYCRVRVTNTGVFREFEKT
jgi:hypothetical protein